MSVKRGARRKSREALAGSQEWLRKGVKSGCARESRVVAQGVVRVRVPRL